MAHVELRTVVHVDNEWRRWIAENLLLDGSPQGIYEQMLRAGIAHEEALRELQQAMASPYVAGAQRLRNRLAKHDWVLDTQRHMNRLRDTEVPRRHKLSREAFLDGYYTAGRPVIITGMMEDWPAMTKWGLDYFKERCGDRDVEIQFGRDSNDQYELHKTAHRKTMLFGDYVELVRNVGRSNNFYMTAYNEGQNRKALDVLWQDIAQMPEYLTSTGLTRGFLWFGPSGTITPFHHDLTNNFMAQVIGRKRVLMMPACEIAHVYNHEHCFTHVDGRQIDLERYPHMRDVQVLSCTLNPGEVLFLPVGCWHFVEGLDISVTVSFTNFLWDNDFMTEYPQQHAF
ncbi:cupin-like domain-containing protein [Dyella sp. M7H15-1]|uniref:cupin-like domain-containing protein n=1 Tax=Dyella sp. M7H15-1 TaxID=2501295 RepID=UPI0010050919|nr:cupin-like domain-containing protein [Dyella sp. M7H15-1]QAU23272.1 cupin-like domain-containing protein [Dyella sp. M7H15-1]